MNMINSDVSFWSWPFLLSQNFVLDIQNHERDSPFTGDRYMNAAADSGGESYKLHSSFLIWPGCIDVAQILAS